MQTDFGAFRLASVPSDSLYKFIALSGLVIFVLSTVLPVYVGTRVFKERIETSVHIEENRINSEYNQDELRLLERSVDEALRKKYGPSVPEAKKNWLPSWMQNFNIENYKNRRVLVVEFSNRELLEKKNKLKALIRDSKLNLARLKGENERVEMLAKLEGILWYGGIIGMISGFFLSFSGFTLWYFRVQAPADRYAARQAYGNAA